MKIYHELTKIILTAFIIFSITVVIGYGYGGSSSGSSSSGSNSGGGVTNSNIDPYSNIVKYEVRDGNLFANKTTEYSFVTPEFSIYKILLNGKENEYGVSVRIEDLKNTSKLGNGMVKPAPGVVYRNENIGLGSSRLNYMGIMFRVKNSWLEDNGLNDSRIPYLLKYNGTAWIVLKTNMTGKDNIYTYFESPKAGNSRVGLFAISAPINRIVSANAIPKNISTTQEEYEEIIPDIEEKEIKSKGIPGFGIHMIIIGVALSLIYINKKRYR